MIDWAHMSPTSTAIWECGSSPGARTTEQGTDERAGQRLPARPCGWSSPGTSASAAASRAI